MAKKKGNIQGEAPVDIVVPISSRKNPSPSIPTDDQRHMTWVRKGKLDTTVVFSKKYLATIPLDHDAFEGVTA